MCKTSKVYQCLRNKSRKRQLYCLGKDFLVGSVGKGSAFNALDTGDTGLIPESGRPLGEGNGNPLQYSCLGNPMERGAWWATAHGVRKSQTQLKQLSMSPLSKCYVVRIGNRSPKWPWLQDKEGKSPRKQNKGRSEDLREDLRQNKQHSWLAQFTQGRPRARKKTYKKRSQSSLSLTRAGTLLHSLLFASLGRNALMPPRWILLLFSK